MSRNKSLGNLALASFGDIFASTTATLPSGEYIVHMPLAELHPPEFNPFQILEDKAMTSLVKSVMEYGVREPCLARPREDGGYELVIGGRRKRASELADIPTLPVIIREMDDDSATIALVDSNILQRELLFSERAWAYRAKMEALNHSGIKGDMHSVDVLTAQTGEKKSQIFRLIRLTELVPDLLDKVDAKKLAFSPAVELSHLTRMEQAAVVDAMAKHEIKPTHSQTVRLKKMSQAGELTPIQIDEMLSGRVKQPKQNKEMSRYKSFFPKGYTSSQMNDVITGLLRSWQADQTNLGKAG